MSQHFYITKRQEETITISIGWDRPLQGFFMVVETNKKIEQPEGEENEESDFNFLYHNLDDKDLFGHLGMCRDIEHFNKKLKEMDLTVPVSMIEEIKLDAINNVGNKTKIHV